MANEDAVCDAEVECDGDDDGDETGPEATNKIGYVANEPDEDEEEGDGFCVSIAVVFDQLGDLLLGRFREYISLFSYTSGMRGETLPTRISSMSTKWIPEDPTQLHGPSRAWFAPQRPQTVTPGMA